MPTGYFAAIALNVSWLQNHLIKCPFKTLTGLDCPGCGFQRSVLYLLNGDLNHSVTLYPATIPIILLAGFSFVNPNRATPNLLKAKKALIIITAALVTGAYLFKLGTYFNG